MRVKVIVVAIAAFGVSMRVAPAVAQHEGHQMPGTAAPTAANVSACAQNAQTVTGAIDQAGARVEDARQLNDPARLRAAVGDLQVLLGQMKAQLADCVALNQPGQTLGNMAAMDHSKMTMAAGAAGTAADQSGSGATSALDIAFKTDPSPARAGDNKFEVTVKDKSGKAVSDAAVSLAFYMPPTPGMGAMRNTVKLTPADNGVYRGEGTVGMAGTWNVTITVMRGQQQLGSKTVKVKAQ
jgi:hypothetical protein